MSQQYSAPPKGVGIQVVDSSDDRLVIAIPPGGKRARGIGCFAFAWLAITVPVSAVFLLVDDANWEGGEAPPLYVLIPFFGIFWAVGIGMLIAWVRMRFTQIYLAVEREQFAIQKMLFGRKKLLKIPLDNQSRAGLVESYRENERPVYAVQIEGIGATEKFGTGLSYEEKHWLTSTINQFLGVESRRFGNQSDGGGLPDYCGDCGSELMTGDEKRVCPDCGRIYHRNDEFSEDDSTDGRAGSSESLLPDHGVRILQRPPALEPYELPADSRVRIDHDDGEMLTFSYGIPIPLVAKIIGGGFLSIFCLTWYGFMAGFIATALAGDEPIGLKIGILAFCSLFLIAGLMPLGMLLTLFFGRARIQLSRETVTGSIGFWYLRKKKSISTESIRDVGLAETLVSSSPMRASRRHSSSRTTNLMSGQKGCVLVSTESNMPLTMSSDAHFNEQVAGLARFQLERLGVTLPHD